MSLKAEAHAAFDHLWKSGRMSKGQAYLWMERVLGVSKRNAHISRLRPPQLERLILFARYLNAKEA